MTLDVASTTHSFDTQHAVYTILQSSGKVSQLVHAGNNHTDM